VLDEASADSDPIRQFAAWLDAARAAGIRNADAMALATAGKDGAPSVRFVLLKAADEQGFVFYTNLESRKALELEENPRAALAFYWVDLGRQVRIEGSVEPAGRDEARAYFETRPRPSRLGAWVSPQSRPIASRAVLDERLAELEQRFAGEDVPLPDFWGGFRVVPATIEFWEHQDSRLHNRLRYRRADGGWTLERLAP
jgi:pyridoxamine 5'-phosphate oxidase